MLPVYKKSHCKSVRFTVVSFSSMSYFKIYLPLTSSYMLLKKPDFSVMHFSSLCSMDITSILYISRYLNIIAYYYAFCTFPPYFFQINILYQIIKHDILIVYSLKIVLQMSRNRNSLASLQMILINNH